MKQEEAKHLIIREWDRWVQTQSINSGRPTGRDSFKFFLELQAARSRVRGVALLPVAIWFCQDSAAGAAASSSAWRSSRADFRARRMLWSSALLSNVMSLRQFGHCF